ncbi:MAG: ATP-binding protein [Dehalococcoidia bacterium]
MNSPNRQRPVLRLRGLALWVGGGGRMQVWVPYAAAIAAVAITVGIRALLEVLFAEQAPTYLVFLAPVIFGALLGGLWPGLFATVLGWVMLELLFIEPTGTLNPTSDGWVITGVFAVEGAAISVVGGLLRSSIAELLTREQELLASEARLLLAQQTARIATYDWDPATGAAVWSEFAEEVMGMPLGSFQGTYADSFRTIIPEDRPLLDAAAEELMRTGHNELEYRIRDSDGRIRWIRGTGHVTRSGPARRQHVVGVMIDITERKRQSETSQFLADATADFASSLDYRNNVADVAAIAVRSFCDIAGVVLMNNGVTPGEIVSRAHRDPERIPLVENFERRIIEEVDQPGILGNAIRSGNPLFLPQLSPSLLDDVEISQLRKDAIRALNVSAVICIPLVARDRTLGALIFAQEVGRKFDEADFRVSVELGRRAALAIENSLLLEQSFEREGEVVRANEALQLVADAGVALGSTLDLTGALGSLADLLVPRFADVCSISVVQDDRLELAAFAAANDPLKEAVESISLRNTAPPDLLASAAQVLRSDRPIFLREVPDELLDRLLGTERDPLAGEAVQPRSLILMPLSARGQTLGVMTFMRVQGSPLFDREDLSLAGQVARRTAVATDNARLYAEARRANDAKDEFLGMMSHELRTPITVIRGGARVLRLRSPHIEPETRDSLLGDIERESERLSRMLENLLALARAELDREVSLEPVLLQRLLPGLIESMIADADREVVLTVDANVPAVAAESGYVEHIVRNLIGNALKYSPGDTVVDVELSRCGDGAAVRVLDRGFGIANDEATRIFERFYRSERTSRLAGGAGLGLAVCKRLVETMSGEIWATPRDGGGVEVAFSLPAYEEEIPNEQ